MATKKPAPKRAPKPAPKPVPKPAEKNLKPRAVPFQTPQPAPLDLVRNPNFDSAMAQQNYQNLLAGLTARAQAGQFDERFDERFRADGGQGFPSKFSRPSGDIGGQGDFRAPIRNFDIDYIEGGPRNAPGLMPIGKFSPEQMQNLTPDRRQALEQRIGMQQGVQQSTNSTAGYMPVDPNRAGYMPVDPNTNMPSLMPIPQAQQMPVPDQQQGARADQYQNFLQQGLANYAAQNYPQQQQGAMGAQAAQNYAGGPMPSPAIPSPQLGGASAQPRGLPRPRQPRGFGSPIGRSAF